MKPLDPTGLKRLHREWRRRTDGRLALVLDSVQSPFNVGSILRTAAAYRVEYVWLSGSTPDAAAPNVRKPALGTDRCLTVGRADDPVTRAHEEGFRVIGIELADEAKPLHELKLTAATCLAFGNEDHGLSASVLRTCDEVAYLPQLGKVGSLNVAAAASIAIFEARRQEWEQAADE